MAKFARHKYLIVFLSALGCLGLLFAASRLLRSPEPLDPSKLHEYSVSELIDGLQHEAAEGLGTCSTAWADGFAALDEAPQFRGGMLNSPAPTTSPVMRELVR